MRTHYCKCVFQKMKEHSLKQAPLRKRALGQIFKSTQFAQLYGSLAPEVSPHVTTSRSLFVFRLCVPKRSESEQSGTAENGRVTRGKFPKILCEWTKFRGFQIFNSPISSECCHLDWTTSSNSNKIGRKCSRIAVSSTDSTLYFVLL